MIIEEFSDYQIPQTSIPKAKTISFICGMMNEVADSFLSALDSSDLFKPLNEDKLTQILISQINALLREREVSITVQAQYNDLFYGTKGKPDFYFDYNEKGKIYKPLFVAESKILPAPLPKNREKEYVIGNKKNGGIERYKIEKHGKGLLDCGLVGFIRTENSKFWLTKINDWINTLAANDNFWQKDEILNQVKNNVQSAYLKSIAHRKTLKDLRLHHFWIITPL